MGTVALRNRTQLFVSSHLLRLLAASACSASLSPQSLAQGRKPTVSVLAHCCSTLWVQLHATQLHPSSRLSESSLTLWVQLHATQLHPSPRLSSLSHWVQSLAEQPHQAPRLRLSSLSHWHWAQLHAEQPHPPPHLISSLSPALPHAPPYVALSPAPQAHLAPPCYPYYTYTSLVAKHVLFCVAYALVCAGRAQAVLYVHASLRRP
jgi:hypothetical protein